jgi:hypothetical protein
MSSFLFYSLTTANSHPLQGLFIIVARAKMTANVSQYTANGVPSAAAWPIPIRGFDGRQVHITYNLASFGAEVYCQKVDGNQEKAQAKRMHVCRHDKAI